MLLTYPLVAQSTNSENINSALREYTLYNNTVPFQAIHELQTIFIDQDFMLTFVMASSSAQEEGREGTHTHTYFHFLIQNLLSQITNIFLLKFLLSYF
jgi:hypothetical protein